MWHLHITFIRNSKTWHLQTFIDLMLYHIKQYPGKDLLNPYCTEEISVVDPIWEHAITVSSMHNCWLVSKEDLRWRGSTLENSQRGPCTSRLSKTLFPTWQASIHHENFPDQWKEGFPQLRGWACDSQGQERPDVGVQMQMTVLRLNLLASCSQNVEFWWPGKKIGKSNCLEIGHH